MALAGVAGSACAGSATSRAAVSAGGEESAAGDACGLAAPIARAARHGAQIGALAVRLRDGAVLAAHEPDLPLLPASTQKLLTAFAALSRFGPAHRFVTELTSDAPPDDAGRVGVLAVRGGGDPALVIEDFVRLAIELRRAGVRRVERLVLDDSAFDDERRHPAWGAPGGRAYEAPVSALTAGYGALSVSVRPGRAVGLALQAVADPPLSAGDVVVRGKTGARGSASSLVVERAAEGGLVVSGSLAAGAEPELVHRSVADATRHAGDTLVWALRASGIEVASTPELGRASVAPVPLLRFKGRDLAEIVRLMLKWSSNPIAEGLLKALGAEASGGQGSFENGAAAVRAALVARGLSVDGATIGDGSGLATTNRATARLLVEVLRAAEVSAELGPELLVGLPIAGRDGTLRARAEGARDRVRAKTGTLSGVASLAGIAHTQSDERIAFAMIVNDGEGAGSAALDAFAEALSRCRAAAP